MLLKTPSESEIVAEFGAAVLKRMHMDSTDEYLKESIHYVEYHARKTGKGAYEAATDLIQRSLSAIELIDQTAQEIKNKTKSSKE